MLRLIHFEARRKTSHGKITESRFLLGPSNTIFPGFPRSILYGICIRQLFTFFLSLVKAAIIEDFSSLSSVVAFLCKVQHNKNNLR